MSTFYHCECDKPKAFYARPEPCVKCQGHLAKEDRKPVYKPIEDKMYELAALYANRMNSKLNIAEWPELDEHNSLPKGCSNAGGWFGFIIGFKVCYKIMKGIQQHERNTTSKSTIP